MSVYILCVWIKEFMFYSFVVFAGWKKAYEPSLNGIKKGLAFNL